MVLLRFLKLAVWLLQVVPAPLLRPVPMLVGCCFYLLNGTQRRMIVANQQQVVPTARPWQLHWHALQIMVALVRSYQQLIQLAFLPETEVLQLVDFQEAERLQCALARGKGAIILGAHIANYNLLAAFTALYHTPAGAFVEPIQPPELFDYVADLRSHTGLQLFLNNREGVVGALRLLKANGILMIAGDRYLGAGGTLVKFFGRPTYLSHGPLVLAQRAGAPLIPASLERLADGRLRVTLREPLTLVDTGNRQHDLLVNMRTLAQALEETIRPVAAQWLMAVPVWSTDPAGQDTAALAVQQAEQPIRIRRAIASGTAVGGLVLLCVRWWRRQSHRA